MDESEFKKVTTAYDKIEANLMQDVIRYQTNLRVPLKPEYD